MLEHGLRLIAYLCVNLPQLDAYLLLVMAPVSMRRIENTACVYPEIQGDVSAHN